MVEPFTVLRELLEDKDLDQSQLVAVIKEKHTSDEVIHVSDFAPMDELPDPASETTLVTDPTSSYSGKGKGMKMLSLKRVKLTPIASQLLGLDQDRRFCLEFMRETNERVGRLMDELTVMQEDMKGVMKRLERPVDYLEHQGSVVDEEEEEEE